MAILIKTFQKDDTFYLKRGNTERAIPVSLVTDKGDIVILSQQDHSVSVTLEKDEKLSLTIPAILSDVFGTVSISLNDNDYRYLGPGLFQGNISIDEKRVEGTFSLVIADSGVTL